MQTGRIMTIHVLIGMMSLDIEMCHLNFTFEKNIHSEINFLYLLCAIPFRASPIFFTETVFMGNNLSKVFMVRTI